MKEKRLLNALGQVDDQYIEEASLDRPVKKPGWLKWAAMAACLCLIAVAALLIPGTLAPASENDQYLDGGNKGSYLDGDPDGYGKAGDLAPMVCVNRIVYQIAANQPDLTGKEDEFVYLGEIVSMVSSSQKPTEDFQANDEIIGCKVYQYDGENVVIEINGQYWLYELLFVYIK